MYNDYWGLREKPFENTPDPRFLYYSKGHEEALSRLLYVTRERKGCAMLTGVFGCGKTLISRALVAELNKNVYQIALVNNPHLTAVEFLRTIARKLGAEHLPEKLTEMSADYFFQLIEEILINNIQDGKENLIIIDEAHVVSDLDIFEEIRLLLNFQFEDRFLLNLILMGQPELAERVKKNKQLLQRIAMGYHLGPLGEQETGNYIEHRLKVAGLSGPIFGENGIRAIFQNSGGIPRRINQICDACLFTGFNYGLKNIDEKIVTEGVVSLGV